jgi:hypothetical protein
VDFEKAFDSINTETLWYEMRTIRVSENMVSSIEIMYKDIKFKCGENQRPSCAPQTKGLCQVVV